MNASRLARPPALQSRPIWPEGSAPSRAARSLGVALVLALSICSQTVAILNFPGTNDYYGMVALHGVAAYSLIEDGTLAKRRGKDLALHLQRFDLLADEASLILAEVEKPAGEKRQCQYVNSENPAGQR